MGQARGKERRHGLDESVGNRKSSGVIRNEHICSEDTTMRNSDASQLTTEYLIKVDVHRARERISST